MKQMIKLVIAVGLMTAMLAPAALAQIDPDPDSIGIYADLEATQVNLMAEAFSTFEVYLIATNISEDDIVNWGLKVVGDSGLHYVGFSVPQSDVNVTLYSTGDEIDIYAYKNDSSTIAVGPHAHLLTLSFTVMDVDPHNLYIEPWHYNGYYPELYPYYHSSRTWGDLLPQVELHPSSGAYDLPVFVVNGEAPVANESMTMGQVKSLYR